MIHMSSYPTDSFHVDMIFQCELISALVIFLSNAVFKSKLMFYIVFQLQRNKFQYSGLNNFSIIQYYSDESIDNF